MKVETLQLLTFLTALASLGGAIGNGIAVWWHCKRDKCVQADHERRIAMLDDPLRREG